MAEVKWIKIVTDVFDDEKMLLIESLPSADSIIVIWFKLLCLAGKNNNSGVFMLNERIAYTDEMLATIFRRDVNTVRLALKTFEMYGMIEVINDVITIPNWSKHQTLDQLEERKEYMKDYMKKYRQKQKALSEGKVNSKANSKANVNSLEEEREEDKKEIKNKKEIENICRQLSSSWTSNGYGTLNKTLLDKLLADVEIYSLEWLIKAIEIGNQRSKRTYSYVKGILENWKTEGIKAEKGRNEIQERLERGEDPF